MAQQQGPGRPEKPESERKQKRTFRIHPLVLAYLKATGNASKTIENTIRRSKGFREWLKKRKK